MTSDEELIERIRRTLRAEAAAVRPNPQEYPMAGAPPGRLLAFRGRWPLAVVAAAVAAAAVVLALVLPGGGGHRIGVVSPATTTPTPTIAPATLPSTTVATVKPGVVPPTTYVAPATTVPVTPVPASFEPQSVTWVSTNDGWALGWDPCYHANCLDMAQTFDGGRTWRSATAPAVAFAPGDTASVRFASATDGWVYLNDTAGHSQLWSTHDGGATWGAIPAASFGGGRIVAMEASGGYVRLVAIGPGQAFLQFYGTPVDNDIWTRTAGSLTVGAGPVPSTELILQRGNGWVLQDDRTVVGGLALAGSGAIWQPWSPPCSNANGVATLAASDPSHLAAICTEGTWGPPGSPGAAPNSQWLFVSADGGSTFHAAGALPSGYQVGGPMTTSGPSTIVAGAYATGSGVHAASGSATAATASGSVLVATFNGGQTWQSVFRAPGVTTWTDVGFTDPEQGVAVGITASGSATLLMTRDGGHTWAPVNLAARS